MAWGEKDFWTGFQSKKGANALIGLGSGLLSGNTFAKGLAAGGQGFMQGAQVDEAYAAEEEQKARLEQQGNVTAKYLQDKGYTDLIPLLEGGHTDQALAQAFARDAEAKAGAAVPDMTANQNDYQFYANQELQANRAPMSFAEWVGGGGAGGGTEYGLTPIWGQMPDGTFAYGVQGKDGTFQPVDTGEMTPLDPRTLAGERAYGANLGGAQGDAAAAAPQDVSTGMIALDLVNQIKTSPELGWATGTSAGLGGNAVPGTGRFGFQTLVDQAKSGAFLTAIQEMRGLGALSNSEGQTATQAITRMNTALSTEDFLKAVEDYERIVQLGVQRAQSRIGGGPDVGAGGVSPQIPSAGQNYVYNPATGRLEPQ